MLYFDGTNDALATPAIDLTGTDSLMALCNVLKVSGVHAELHACLCFQEVKHMHKLWCLRVRIWYFHSIIHPPAEHVVYLTRGIDVRHRPLEQIKADLSE